MHTRTRKTRHMHAVILILDFIVGLAGDSRASIFLFSIHSVFIWLNSVLFLLFFFVAFQTQTTKFIFVIWMCVVSVFLSL